MRDEQRWTLSIRAAATTAAVGARRTWAVSMISALSSPGGGRRTQNAPQQVGCACASTGQAACIAALSEGLAEVDDLIVDRQVIDLNLSIVVAAKALSATGDQADLLDMPAASLSLDLRPRKLAALASIVVEA
jgi:hypothetical protein